jgi:superfamily II DNA or RNA helicase
MKQNSKKASTKDAREPIFHSTTNKTSVPKKDYKAPFHTTYQQLALSSLLNKRIIISLPIGFGKNPKTA